MDYHMFETATLLASVLLLTALVQDGNSNWLKVRR
jgi:Ca2+/H+ antiporter